MRKIYSLVLIATALLIGTNAWADGVIKLVRTGATYEHLNDAFAAAKDGDILELTNNMNETQSDGAAWFGETTSGTLANYATTDRSITLDLKGHLYNLTGDANYKIALTRGVLKIQSTGGKGEIKSNKGVIAVYGTYLKIDAKTQTPFTHLIIEENVTITSGTGANNYRAVVLNSPLRPYQVTSEWGWASTALYPCDYQCEIYPVSQFGVSNGARIDIYGKVVGEKYACQVSGNIRSSNEYLNQDGSYNTSKGHFPLYMKKSETELYLPGTTMTGKTASGSYYYDNVISSSNDYVLTASDDDYTGYIHVHSTAELRTNNPNSPKAVGLYCAGFARCYVEGTCEGSTGVYVKGGQVELHDATVVSSWTQNYKPASVDGETSGVNGGGSAIVIESKDGWTGNINVTISGDTHVSTEHGYAIDEKVTTGGQTHVNYLTITGGTFDGGDVPVYTANPDKPTGYDTTYVQGTMAVSQPTLDAHHNPDTITTITILGAEVKGETNQIGEGEGQVTLAEFIAGQSGTHVTYVEDELGNTTMVVSQGEAPATNPDEIFTDWQYIAANQGANKSFAWTKVPEEDEIPENGTVVLDELQINSGSALEGTQQLTIKEGAVLEVNRLIMNAYARIIVKAGGKLIVNGTQGISAPSTQNIVLESTADKQAYFLFNPAVSSNKYPNATVEFESKAYNEGGKHVYQRFGVPTWDREGTDTDPKHYNTAMKSLHKEYGNSWVAQYDYTIDNWGAWQSFGGESNFTIVDALPFRGYLLASNNAKADKMKYEFAGQLIGNQNENLHMYNGWNYFANSYTAPVDIKEFINTVIATLGEENKNKILATVYLYMDSGNDDYIWYGVNKTNAGDDGLMIVGEDIQPIKIPTTIQPMQAFLLRLNAVGEADQAINYQCNVYNPYMNIPNAPITAPARMAQTDNKMQVLVSGNSSWDKVQIIENDNFSDEMDNGYDAYKYNEGRGVSLYALNGEANMDIFATDDAEGTFIGIDAKQAGNYTMHIEGVEGMEYAIVDMQTNAVINAVNGTKYQFYTAAGKNDYRFQIVSASKVVTDIDNVEIKENVKGVYTITGQYFGENVDALPAGLYIINGVKVVK